MLSQPILTGLRIAAAYEQTSMSELIERLLRVYLEKRYSK
jgi:hypothetical protein